MKILSEYFSDDNKRSSKVLYIGEKKFRVVVVDEMCANYATVFDNEEDAENYAEDWVMNK